MSKMVEIKKTSRVFPRGWSGGQSSVFCLLLARFPSRHVEAVALRIEPLDGHFYPGIGGVTPVVQESLHREAELLGVLAPTLVGALRRVEEELHHDRRDGVGGYARVVRKEARDGRLVQTPEFCCHTLYRVTEVLPPILFGIRRDVNSNDERHGRSPFLGVWPNYNTNLPSCQEPAFTLQ